ncbi:hypothetical protein [Tenacibaculum sp. M341]|uniref:hypothetical protein n=1 Tax=Tenacibaculum sp. M341 TaxID=2530339 RepID=UPI00104845C0|nr:hypothetical protein [Tenacibaculum sp. M341]TCI84925.1 hypothetical protein EYW44_18795 [Tenacibaculum sp. M341]
MEQKKLQKKNKEIEKNKIKPILLGIVAFVIVTMSLLSFPFKRYSKEFLAHKKTYRPIIDGRNKAQDSLRNELGTTLTIDEYKKASEKSWSFYMGKLDAYKKKKELLMNDQRFLGRANFRYWLTQFGIILLGLYFSVKSLYDDYRKNLKTGHRFISQIGILVSLFWMYHLFFRTAADFYTETYVITEIVLCIIAAFFIANLIKYYAKRESVVKGLISLVLRIKTKHYRNILVKALYAEKHDKSMDSIETTRSQSDEFDRDVKDTFNKVLG